MLSFTIKTWRETTPPVLHSFYVLNKGLNSGKPGRKPWRNSFMVIAEDSAEAELYYWITYCAWLTRKFEPYLRGSVIPFITIHHLKEVILQNSENAIINPSKVNRLLSTFRKLDLVEKQQEELLLLCRVAKKATAMKFVQSRATQTKIPHLPQE